MNFHPYFLKGAIVTAAEKKKDLYENFFSAVLI